MINKSNILRILSLSLATVGFVVIGGNVTETRAQQGGDPFSKPAWAKPRNTAPASTGASGAVKAAKPAKPLPPPVIPITAPEINQRINYYKQMRLQAAESGQPLPKVTSVLTLDEMAIIGIFRTPRGYAAMVEAKPIKLSYTIYPGEKFFDGQLVAIEENRLVFRKVTKMTNGKFIASVENKALREYSNEAQIQGTAPIQTEEKPTEIAATAAPAPSAEAKPNMPTAPANVVSPLDEMNKQPEEAPKTDKTDKKGKKAVKVAKNKK
jgi:hypothetical protein